jgi:hypothetical protein
VPARRAQCRQRACQLATNCLARMACRYRGRARSRGRRLPASRAPCRPPACQRPRLYPARMVGHCQGRLRTHQAHRRGITSLRLKPRPAAKGFPQGRGGTASQKARSHPRSRLQVCLRRRGRNHRTHSPRVRIHHKTVSRHQLQTANLRLPGLVPPRRRNHNRPSKTRRGRFNSARRSRFSSRARRSRLRSQASRRQNRSLLAASLVCRPAADVSWAALILNRPRGQGGRDPGGWYSQPITPPLRRGKATVRAGITDMELEN